MIGQYLKDIKTYTQSLQEVFSAGVEPQDLIWWRDSLLKIWYSIVPYSLTKYLKWWYIIVSYWSRRYSKRQYFSVSYWFRQYLKWYILRSRLLSGLDKWWFLECSLLKYPLLFMVTFYQRVDNWTVDNWSLLNEPLFFMFIF